MNSPLEELVECVSLSLSHSFNMSAAVSDLPSRSHSGEVGSVGESCVNDVLIISAAGPLQPKNLYVFILFFIMIY